MCEKTYWYKSSVVPSDVRKTIRRRSVVNAARIAIGGVPSTWTEEAFRGLNAAVMQAAALGYAVSHGIVFG